MEFQNQMSTKPAMTRVPRPKNSNILPSSTRTNINANEHRSGRKKYQKRFLLHGSQCAGVDAGRGKPPPYKNQTVASTGSTYSLKPSTRRKRTAFPAST